MKKSVIFRLFLSTLLLFFTTVQMDAQGLYSRKNAQNKDAEMSNSGEVIKRANKNDIDNVNVAGGNDTQVPLGEGILILSLLTGGYALIKRRNIKNGDEE